MPCRTSLTAACRSCSKRFCAATKKRRHNFSRRGNEFQINRERVRVVSGCHRERTELGQTNLLTTTMFTLGGRKAMSILGKDNCMGFENTYQTQISRHARNHENTLMQCIKNIRLVDDCMCCLMFLVSEISWKEHSGDIRDFSESKHDQNINFCQRYP